MAQAAVVHPAHAHANDAAYHAVMNVLSGKTYQSLTTLAIESKQSEKDTRRVIKHMINEDLVEEEGKMYRIAGYSHG